MSREDSVIEREWFTKQIATYGSLLSLSAQHFGLDNPVSVTCTIWQQIKIPTLFNRFKNLNSQPSLLEHQGWFASNVRGKFVRSSCRQKKLHALRNQLITKNKNSNTDPTHSRVCSSKVSVRLSVRVQRFASPHSSSFNVQIAT